MMLSDSMRLLALVRFRAVYVGVLAGFFAAAIAPDAKGQNSDAKTTRAESAAKGKYTARDLGFMELSPRPYRLIILYDAATADSARKTESKLRMELAGGNVILVLVPHQQRKDYPLLERLDIPDKLTAPLLWLESPDDRVTGFDPDDAPRELLQSPLRHALASEVTQALGTILLLESSDAIANELARTRAGRVVKQINEAKSKLDKAPATDVKLLTLPAANRQEERWLLWALGEPVPAAALPKVAVVFGNLRRAGEPFEGTDWKEDDLFARLAILGEFCEGGEPKAAGTPQWRAPYSSPALPFRKPAAWQDKVTKTLAFNPDSPSAQAEVKGLLSHSALRKPRRLTYAAVMSGAREEEPDEGEAQKDKLPGGEGRKIDIESDPPEALEDNHRAIEKAHVAPPFAYDEHIGGGIVLVAGVIGWIALATGFWIVLRRQAELS